MRPASSSPFCKMMCQDITVYLCLLRTISDRRMCLGKSDRYVSIGNGMQCFVVVSGNIVINVHIFSIN
jgi:hypothetical protein